MENFIQITITQKDGSTSELTVDNGTQFKDFNLKTVRPEDNSQLSLDIMFSKDEIRINNVVLDGLVLQLFKQFINQ